MAKKSAAQLQRDIDEAEALRELEEARERRRRSASPPTSVRADDYAGQLRYWNDYAAKWGKPAAVKRATDSVAGTFLSRDFGESAESFYARSPSARATRDWLDRNRG